MRTFSIAFAAAMLAAVGIAAADGGAIVGHEETAELAVTVFAAPVPLRAGLVDISVLVQSARDEVAVLDADVEVTLSSGGGVVDRARADHGGATNRLFYAAQIEIPAPGAWRLDVAVEHETAEASLQAVLEAAPGLATASRFWPWLVLPLVVVGVFLLHQWLNER